ncbi:hypothetical protein ACEPAH_2783 [Sanghuangporus vaninii]
MMVNEFDLPQPTFKFDVHLTTTSDTRHEYVVFIPTGSTDGPFGVDVPENAKVQDLSIAYKCEVIALHPGETLLSRTSTWLRGQNANSKTLPVRSLRSYFPIGPAPSKGVDWKKMVIDVVIVTSFIMEKDDFVYALPDRNECRLIGTSLKKASVTN